MCATRIWSVKPPRSSVTETPSVWPTRSHSAMSIADFAAGFPTVRAIRAWATSRSRGDNPSSCGAKMPWVTAMIPAWVSPYVKGRGGASAVPTSPSSVWTRTSTCSAADTSPLAKRNAFAYGMRYGMVSMPVIFMSQPRSAEELVDGANGVLVHLNLWDVSAVLEDGDLAAADGVRELVGVRDRSELVLAAPQNEGAGADPVEPAAQSSIGDRPGELAGAAEGPDHARDGGSHLLGVLGHGQHGLRGGAGGIVEEERRQLVGRCGDPVRGWVLVHPQADGVQKDEGRREVGEVGGQL